jgi:hypothetical protein
MGNGIYFKIAGWVDLDMLHIFILFVLYFKNYLEIDVKFKLQKCAACQDLPTLQF